ncbi:MATE family efflux transporter [Alteromonas aestuariivivens]|uniref:Multidrug-efflux transporter n=1 Tax=Alteromonas aestuariivivens TaxID=1938339 RepID=A0A3D8MB41_9ALTE|nr:MATE family efflux transporter [Alteromonas aestuariivivens]RDV27341.1 MATE family efflux transporter [Alteromonas aestuariivivens]
MQLVSRRMAVESRRLINLAWPLLIAQVTQMMMGVIDTIMAGRYSATDMAAVALGFSITIPLMSFLQGLAFAIPPLISRLHGKGQTNQIANAAQQAGYLLLCISLLIVAIFPFTGQLVALFPMEEALYTITVDYVRYVLLAMPGFALYQWLRNYCEALGNTKPTMVITVIGLCFNVLGNYLFIYGAGPIPAFGGAGCGLATCLVIYAMLFATLFYTRYAPRLARYRLFDTLHRPQLRQIMRTFGLGLPIAMTLLFEVTLFAVVALLLAPFGASTVAAHQVALNFSALMFMFPLSMGMAISIQVSYRIGQSRPRQARIAVKSALLIGLLVAIATATFTVLAKKAIISLYTTDQAVVELASALLIYAALFQFSDAVQVISANTLRGFKDTTAMFIITFCAYWLIGLPTGIILGRTDWLTDAPMSAAGFWIGFIVGLSSAAVLLGGRVYVLQKRKLG